MQLIKKDSQDIATLSNMAESLVNLIKNPNDDQYESLINEVVKDTTSKG